MKSSRASKRSHDVRPGLAALAVLMVVGACTPEQREALHEWSKRPPPPPPACPASCDDGNACTVDSCGPATNFACSHAPAEQQSCSDGLTCTVNDRCVAGACRGEVLACAAGACSEPAGCPMPPPPPTCPASCDDGNVCTIDSCGPATNFACSHAPAEQQSCSDGLTCTVNDRCVAGACRGEVLACAAGTCSEPVGCPMPPPPARQCPETSWAQMLPGMAETGIRATFHGLATNDVGEVVVAGSIWGDIALPAGVQVAGPPQGDSDLLLAKVNGSDGTTAWARTFGDDGHRQTIRKVALSNQGVVGFFGEIDGTIDFGAGVTVGPPVAPPADQRPPYWTGTFLAGVRSSDGSGVFAVDLGFTTQGLVDMAASPVDGSFVVCGRSAPYTPGPDHDVDAYVAKFSARGERLWNASASLASSERDSCEAVVVLDDGDVVLGGLHGLGPTRALWFAKLDGSTGARKWSRTFALSDRSLPSGPDVAIAVVSDLAADANGDLAFAGTLWRQVDFGGRVGTIVVPGSDDHETVSSDALVVKLDGDSGEPIWARRFGEPGTGVVPWEYGTTIAFDSRGDVHATGETRTPEPASTGYHDLLQWKLAGPDGSTLCARTYGGAQNQTSGELVINRRGTGSARDQAVLLGWFNQVIDFGGGLRLQAPRDFSYFLTRFQP